MSLITLSGVLTKEALMLELLLDPL
jgi:hypothetical protein